MAYAVVLPKKAQKDLARIDSRYRIRVALALKLLGQDPFQGKKLTGEHAGEYSVRVWPYRIIYKIYKHELLVIVVKIGHRQEVY
ncbi:MAG: type II toxin-antitoxin system RelE/ParE family toxin [Patescibacteria group bacterium]